MNDPILMPTPLDLPKLAPDRVSRIALEAWLDAHAGYPLRIVAAQPGAGKTTAVACWAGKHERTAWIGVPAGATRSDLCALLMCALAPAEALTLAHALRSTAKTTIVIDNADTADAQGRALLEQLPADAPRGVSFVYLLRDRTAIDVRRVPVPAALAPPALLRFDERDVEGLCAARGLAASAGERRRLLAATGGWALAVAGTMRNAAALGGTFDDAFQRWLATSRPFLDGLVAEALNAVSKELAASFIRVVTGQVSTGDPTFALLEAAGLFVEGDAGASRINPVVAAFERREDRRPWFAPAMLHVFGRFRMTIGDREVLFARRRDRQIVQFLALRPSRSATRSELLQEFWSDNDPHTASQRLRSACATISRSIGECVGRANVAAYFQVDAKAVRLDAARVTSTEQRFRSHVDLAVASEEAGALDAAYAHWSAALAIHTAPLLAGEPAAMWIEPTQRELATFARRAAERVRNLAYVEVVQTNVLLA